MNTSARSLPSSSTITELGHFVGPHTRLYWTFPTFTASPGTTVAAPTPRQLAMRMHDTEYAATSAASAARARTPRRKRP
jgi:hypothetical protein